MGLRDRLDRLEGQATWTMHEWRELALAALEFLASLQNGLAIGGEIGGHRVRANLIIDPTYSVLPQPTCEFVGGPHDGKRYTLSEPQQRRQTITLKGGAVYRRDGWRFQYDGPHEEAELKE